MTTLAMVTVDCARPAELARFWGDPDGHLFCLARWAG